MVIGGTLLSGGFGFVAGSLIGALIQGVIQTLISFQGTLDVSWTKIFVGGLLLVFILLQRVFSQGMKKGGAAATGRAPRLAWAGTPAGDPAVGSTAGSGKP